MTMFRKFVGEMKADAARGASDESVPLIFFFHTKTTHVTATAV
jgi:hypothetical protein